MCVCEQRHDLHLCASQPKASCDPNCSPRTPAQLVVFFILIIFPSSLTFQLPYFVILWSPPAGNFCAGYDQKELANHTASLKLEQDVTKGPSLMSPSRLELSKLLIAALSGFLAHLRLVEGSAVAGVFCHRFGATNTSHSHPSVCSTAAHVDNSSHDLLVLIKSLLRYVLVLKKYPT
uniref:Uncharacterized protein n=1 Tax=Mola mola TaxID=94237 RepID=A0A3Q3WD95_MOLML